jgi:hypothetical protein
MKLWEDIINKATLGSQKLPLRSVEIPEIISQVSSEEIISTMTWDIINLPGVQQIPDHP